LSVLTRAALTRRRLFGPQLRFAKGCGAGEPENLAPCFGLQFFGHVAIDGATEVMTVTLKDVAGDALWSTEIAPTPVPIHDAAIIAI
jgi:alkaline phosphatase D